MFRDRTKFFVMWSPVAVCLLVLWLGSVSSSPSSNRTVLVLEDQHKSDETRYTAQNKNWDLEVCTSMGCLLGTTEEGFERPYLAWYGVPYATPPLGDLRFEV